MRLAPWSLLPLIFTTSLVACGDDTTAVDEVGSDSSDSSDSSGESATESGSTDGSTDASTSDTTSSTDTTDATETTETTETDTTETTGGGVCDANDVVDADITLALVGSQSPADGCGDHVFTGTLQGGGGGNWLLDACPCGALCLVPDPYTLSVVVPDAAMLPNVPDCPSIVIHRDAACEVAWITVGIANQAEVSWIGSREAIEPTNVFGLDVTSELFGVCECPDCDPPTLYDLNFQWQNEALVLGEGESGVVGDATVYSVSSHTYEVGDTRHFAWVMKR